jgi:AmmeMemoRadiSam system protein B
VADDVAREFVGSELIVATHRPHEREHAIEVQLPFIKSLIPEAKIVPIGVRPVAAAIRVGQAVGEYVLRDSRRIVVAGSTDLTHYGPAFGFEPEGGGLTGRQWAKDVNDRRLVERIIDLDAEGVLSEAEAHHNACGGGAVAATLAAMCLVGATHYMELQHSTSADVAAAHDPNPENSVGYEAGIFCKPT